MSAILNLNIRLGLVAIPVGLVAATKKNDVGFRTLHRACMTPVNERLYCPADERLVAAEECAKGYEVAAGQYVLIDEDDLAELAVESSHLVEISDVVDAAAITSVYVKRTYYLAPSELVLAKRTYRIVAAALAERAEAALGRFAAWGHEQLCAITTDDGITLILQTLLAHEQVNGRGEIHEALADVQAEQSEIELALQVLASYRRDFDPERMLVSNRAALLRELVERTLAGGQLEIPVAAARGEPAILPPVDIRDALRKSIRPKRARRRANTRA